MGYLAIIFLLVSPLAGGCNQDTDQATLDEAADKPAAPSRPANINAVDTINHGGHSVDGEGSARPPARLDATSSRQLAARARPVADQMIAIPGGTLLAGSAPEDTRRVHFAENDLVPHEMTPFEMDSLPFPNDPDRAFLTGVTRDEATRACQDAGKRLCTELEWERACKSAENNRYPTGSHYDGRNSAPEDRHSHMHEQRCCFV